MKVNRSVIRYLSVIALSATVTVAAHASPANVVNFTQETKPVMGWSTWSFYRLHPSLKAVEAQALALHRSGLQAHGYEYVNLDEGWYDCPDSKGPEVDKYGRWRVNDKAFPTREGVNGIERLAEYVHSLGLKFGIYLTPGISKRAVAEGARIKGTRYTADQIAEPDIKELNYNCGGMIGIDFKKPGSQSFINSLADRFAAWGVDYVKLDGISNANVPNIVAWHKAIAQSGRPMVLDITDGVFTIAIMHTLMKYAGQWEMLSDIECYSCDKDGDSFPLTNWAHVKKRFTWVSKMQPYAGHGHFNDYDSIEVGNGRNSGLTSTEDKTQISLWAMGSAPLILGADLTHLAPLDLKYLTNSAVLSVDQDGVAAKLVKNDHAAHALGPYVYAKREPDRGDVIIGFFNPTDESQSITVRTIVAGLRARSKSYALHNLWTGKTRTAKGPYIHVKVAPHGVVLYRADAH